VSVEADLAAAWNLMTDSLRAEQRKRFEKFEKDTGEDFVSFIRRQQVQTAFDFDDQKLDVRESDGGRIRVRLFGRARTSPLDSPREDAAKVQDFVAVLTLIPCLRSELVPNGLLVASIEREFYDGARSAETSDTKRR
jgi:hypothetical protein